VLKERAEHEGTPFVPFDVRTDYGDYVDGRPRTRACRASWSPGHPPAAGLPTTRGHDTVDAVGNAKNERVQH